MLFVLKGNRIGVSVVINFYDENHEENSLESKVDLI